MYSVFRLTCETIIIKDSRKPTNIVLMLTLNDRNNSEPISGSLVQSLMTVYVVGIYNVVKLNNKNTELHYYPFLLVCSK